MSVMLFLNVTSKTVPTVYRHLRSTQNVSPFLSVISAVKAFTINKNGVLFSNFPDVAVSSTNLAGGTNTKRLNLSYNRQYLVKSKSFEKTIFRREQLVCDSATDSNTLNRLRMLSRNEGSVEDLMGNRNLLVLLKEEMNTLNFYELLEILGLALCCSTKYESERFWNELLTDLTVEFHKRPTESLFDDTLKLLDMLYVLREYKNKNCQHLFSYKINKLCYKAKRSTPEQMVHLFFFIGRRNVNIRDTAFLLQQLVYNRISQLNLNDLAVIMDGFKQNSIVLNFPGLGESILKKTLSEIETIDSKCLHLICKGLISFRNIKAVINFQEAVTPHISRFDPAALLDMAYIGSTTNVFNFTFCTKVLERVKQSLKNCCLMDISRSANLTVHLNMVDDGEFLNLAISEMEMRKQQLLVGNFGVEFIQSLVFHRLYPENLIKYVVTEDFFRKMLKSKSYRGIGILWFINCSLEIEKPEYHVKLEKKFRDKIQHVADNQKIELKKRRSEKITSHKVEATLEKMYEKNAILFKKILPHYFGMCVLRLDKNLKSQPIPEAYKVAERGCISKPSDENHFWACVVILQATHFADETELNCLGKTKLRQLTKLGYKPVLIKEQEWHSLGDGSRASYLTEAIYGALNNKEI